MVAERLREYEMVMILRPQVNEEEVTTIMDRVKAFISGNGGNLSEEEELWGLRRMAYPIEKFTEGFYILTKFALNSSDVLALNNLLNTSEDVIRYLVMKI